MLHKKPNRKKHESGQSLLEAALVLMVLLALLIGALDFGQLLFFHQAIVERVRSAVRWGAVNPYDGTGDKIASVVMYGTPNWTDPQTPGFLGLTRENVTVAYQSGTVANPNDERVSVTITGYRYQFFSPWIAGSFTNGNPIFESSPMFYKP